MSEFKFACPVCGQHITADPASSGRRIDCPTCFQKLIIPQAPVSGDSKLILTAAKAERPGRDLSAVSASAERQRAKSLPSWIPTLLFLLALGVAGLAAYSYRARLARLFRPAQTNAAAHDPGDSSHSRPVSRYPVPTNVVWTLDPAKMAIPETKAAGRIHGEGFLCESATLTGGTLNLMQNQGALGELGMSLMLPAQRGAYLSGKQVVLGPGATIKVPMLVLHWKDGQNAAAKEQFTGGYALKLSFGQATAGRMPGEIYVALPDNAKSFVAGKFEATISEP